VGGAIGRSVAAFHPAPHPNLLPVNGKKGRYVASARASIQSQKALELADEGDEISVRRLDPCIPEQTRHHDGSNYVNGEADSQTHRLPVQDIAQDDA